MITAYRGEEGSAHLEDLMDWGSDVFFSLWDLVEEEGRPQCWIAGGAPLDYLSGTEMRDIDLWFPNEENYDQVARAMSALGAKLIKNTNSSTVYEVREVGGNSSSIPAGKYELVKKYFDSAEETIEYFDFTVSAIAVGRDFVTYHEKFFEHLATGALEFNSLNLPTNSLRRLPKYVAKGFTPSDATLERLAERLTCVDMDNPKENIFARIRDEKDEDTYSNLPMSTRKKPYNQPFNQLPPFAGYSTQPAAVTIHPNPGISQPPGPKKRKFFKLAQNNASDSYSGGYNASGGYSGGY